jgi:CubicO group peptidase (beta-lactamase class C family)
MMYVVAAEVITRASGMPIEDFIRSRIFAPLGMRESFFHAKELATRDNVAGGHLIDDGVARAIPPYTSDAPLGAAGIHTSVADMTRWIRMLLGAGAYEGKRIVTAASVAETLKPQMWLAQVGYPAAREAHPHFYAYSLGWFVQDYQGHVLNMHTGSVYGSNALVALVPDMHLGVVILIDAEPVEYRHAFMYEVVDRYLSHPERDWNTDLLKVYGDGERAELSRRAAAQAQRRAPPPGATPEDYVGLFDNPLAGDSRIVNEGGTLFLLMPPEGRFSLSHWSYDSFEAADVRAPSDRFLLTFTRDVNGSVSGYEVAGRRSTRRPH